MLDMLTDITEGRGSEEDLDLLEELGGVIKEASLCGLGGTAPNPVLSTIRYFRDEYEAHVLHKRCPAGVCKALIAYSVDEAKCTGCRVCAKECPEGAVSGEKKKLHVIDPAKCIKCGLCRDLCKFDAILVS
jgi:NAD-dependent dihydropyrimidine dehydrogenase PreA subunit